MLPIKGFPRTLTVASPGWKVVPLLSQNVLGCFLPNTFIDCKPNLKVGFYPTNDAGGNALPNSHLIYLFELLWEGTPVLTRVAFLYATSSTLEARLSRTVFLLYLQLGNLLQAVNQLQRLR